jgi:hypothetical protein
MFRGFKGYIQADAHGIYDALFRGDAVDEGEKPPDEVACWSHCRRKFWEAAIATKDPTAREALLRIGTLFELEEKWAGLAPRQRHEHRQRVSRPMLDDFFAWAAGVFEHVGKVRGPLATAFGYALRQREALRSFLDDGRLRLENNAAERALRAIAVGRNAWLFFGSGDHAQAAANMYPLLGGPGFAGDLGDPNWAACGSARVGGRSTWRSGRRAAARRGRSRKATASRRRRFAGGRAS